MKFLLLIVLVFVVLLVLRKIQGGGQSGSSAVLGNELGTDGDVRSLRCESACQ